MSRPVSSGYYGPDDGPAFRQDVEEAALALARAEEPITCASIARAMNMHRTTISAYCSTFEVSIREVRRDALARLLADPVVIPT